LAFAAKPEPNAFLNEAADTHDRLMGQIQKDPAVMSRYMRHFGKSRQEVIDYFKTLRAGSLPSDGVYLVYNSQEWEELQAKVMFFKKGMPVWQDPNGTVILKMSCGNPMVRGTDDIAVVTTNEPTTELITETRDLIMGQDLPVPVKGEAVDLVTRPELVTDFAVDSSAQTFAPIMPLVPGVVPAAGGIGNILPIAGIIPVLAFLGNDGDSGITPIPEPATMLVLSGAIGTLIARRRGQR